MATSRAEESSRQAREAEGENKRRSERIAKGFPVTYANLSAKEKTSYRYYKSAIIDLSDTGIGLTVEEMIDKMDLLQIVMTVPVKPYVITALAETVWSKPIPGTTRFRAGLRFIQSPPELNQALIGELK